MKEAMRQLLCKAYLVQLGKGDFSARELSEESGFSYGYASSLLAKLLASGRARRVRERSLLGSGGRSCLRGLSAARYVLTPGGRKGIRVVLTGGVFDMVHPGHLHMLTESKKHGDLLVLVVARDSTMLRRKGREPVNGELDRLRVVSPMRQVDAAILGSEDSFMHTLRKVSPDVVCLGHDQHEDLRHVSGLIGRAGMKTSIVQLRPLPGYSTSTVIRKIKGS